MDDNTITPKDPERAVAWEYNSIRYEFYKDSKYHLQLEGCYLQKMHVVFIRVMKV